MIRAHEDPTVLTLDVEGPATMVESPAVHETARAQLSRGVRSLRVDLRDCTSMDSTFSGTLLWLKRQLDAAGGDFTLVSPSPRALDVLREMGLEDFYAIDTADRPDEGAAWREIAPARPGVESFRRLVIDAHDELSRIPGPEARGFRAVADELRREERRSRAPG